MQNSDTNASAAGKPRSRALRLTFEYSDDEIELRSLRRLAMIPSPPHPLVPDREERGFWIVLADANGRPLYRRVMENPIRGDFEVVTGDPDRPLARIPREEKKGTFFVVVPDIPGARTVAVFGAGAGTEQRAAPTRELSRFDLDSATEEGR